MANQITKQNNHLALLNHDCVCHIRGFIPEIEGECLTRIGYLYYVKYYKKIIYFYNLMMFLCRYSGYHSCISHKVSRFIYNRFNMRAATKICNLLNNMRINQRLALNKLKDKQFIIDTGGYKFFSSLYHLCPYIIVVLNKQYVDVNIHTMKILVNSIRPLLKIIASNIDKPETREQNICRLCSSNAINRHRYCRMCY